MAANDEHGRDAPSGLARWVPLWALVPFAVLVWRYDFLTDDGFISFRYARNLAQGLGPIYNPGVSPPVEGYTEFGWVIALALAAKAGFDLEIASRLMSALCGLILMVWTLRSAVRAAGPRGGGAVAAGLFLCTLPPLAVWSTGGMGTMPYALCVFGLFAALFDNPDRPRPIAAAAWGAGLLLMRADGFTWAAGLLLAGIVLGPAERRKAALQASAACAIVFAFHLAWRWSTYGDWLPNTARAKVGWSQPVFERGAKYVVSVCLALPAIPAALGLTLLLGNVRLGRAGWTAVAGSLGCAAYAILAGGDFMAYGRFLVPALPLVGWALARAMGTWNLAVPVGAVLGLALAGTSVATMLDRPLVPEAQRIRADFRYMVRDFQSEETYWETMRRRGANWAMIGRLIGEFANPADSIVLGAIGGMGYHSNLFVYDRYGLVTRSVAQRELGPNDELRSPGHDKGVEREYFLSENPTWMGAFIREPREKLPNYARRRKRATFPIPPGHPALALFPEGSELVLVRP